MGTAPVALVVVVAPPWISVAHSNALMLMVTLGFAFATQAWMSHGHWKCCQKPRDSK